MLERLEINTLWKILHKKYLNLKNYILIQASKAKANLWRQVAPVAGGELVKGLGANVAAPEWLGGDDIVQRREGLFHRGTDGRRLITHLQAYRIR